MMYCRLVVKCAGEWYFFSRNVSSVCCTVLNSFNKRCVFSCKFHCWMINSLSTFETFCYLFFSLSQRVFVSLLWFKQRNIGTVSISVADPDPQDPYVFLPPSSISQRYGSGSFYHQAKIVRKTLISSVFFNFLLTFYLWKMM